MPAPKLPDGRPPAREGIPARKVVLSGVVPPGEYFAARAGDSPFTPGERITPGTHLPRPVPAWTFPDVAPEEPIPFDYRVLHEDEELVVVDKPPFLPATGNGRIQRETVQTRLRIAYGDEVTVLHRLDRLTAGVLLCSRRKQTRAVYQRLFAHRLVRKRYLAQVTSPLDLPEWTEVRLPMTKQPGQRQVTVDTDGTETITWVRGQGRIVELEPVTGHTHQLRVLLNHLNAPIVGDDTYPVDRGLNLRDYSTPLQLLATELSFIDPLSSTPRAFPSKQRIPANIGELELKDG